MLGRASRVRRDESAARVDEFQSRLRGAAQELGENSPVPVLSGSMGPGPLVRRPGIPDRIDHLDPFRLGPWSRDTSVACFARLAESQAYGHSQRQSTSRAGPWRAQYDAPGWERHSLPPRSPGIDSLDASVAELARVPRHDGKPARGGRCGEEGIRHAVVKRLAAPSLFLHYPRASTGVGQCPVDDATLEQFVDKVLEPFGQTAPAAAGG